MNYRNAKHISDGRIDCEIEHPVHGWIPYTLNPADPDLIAQETNGGLLAAMAEAGDVEAYVPPKQEELDAELVAQLREERDQLLLGVDTIAGNALRWGELSAEHQAAWGVYRLALLGVPQQTGFPNVVVWPTKP